MERWARAAGVRLCLLAGLAGVVGGCATIRVTNPPRTATEQFLESQAIAKAVDQLNTAALRDRRVFVDPTYLIPSLQPSAAAGQTTYISANAQPSAEQIFMLGELRAKLLAAGMRLAQKREDAQVIVEIRTGGVGIDSTDFLLGIPALYLPGAAAGVSSVATPEVVLFKMLKQRGYAGVSIVAYWADTGEWIASSGPAIGRTLREDYWIFGWGPKTVGDIVPASEK